MPSLWGTCLTVWCSGNVGECCGSFAGGCQRLRPVSTGFVFIVACRLCGGVWCFSMCAGIALRPLAGVASGLRFGVRFVALGFSWLLVLVVLALVTVLVFRFGFR